MKTFLLGVGCQKGGTTWLHNYIDQNPASDLGFRKEYHIFDAHWLPDRSTRHFYSQAVDRLIGRAKKHKPTFQKNGTKPDRMLEKSLLHVSFLNNTENYAEYFSRLYSANDSTKLVGDITPSYSGLSVENYKEIRRLLENHGFHIKVIFLMRDPIERAYSAARMKSRRNRNKADQSSIDPVAFFNKRIKTPGFELRSRYQHTIEALDAAFDKEDVLYGFYETLFSENEVKRITDFLGIDYLAPDFEKRVNASPNPVKLDAESIASARDHYDSTYRACMDRFGESFIKSIWKNA